jgi:hypothetical protein
MFYVACKKASELEEGFLVVIAPDGGEKYLSTKRCNPGRCLACVRKYGIPCAYSDGIPLSKIGTSNL